MAYHQEKQGVMLQIKLYRSNRPNKQKKNTSAAVLFPKGIWQQFCLGEHIQTCGGFCLTVLEAVGNNDFLCRTHFQNRSLNMFRMKHTFCYHEILKFRGLHCYFFCHTNAMLHQLRNCELSFLKSVILATLFISVLHPRGQTEGSCKFMLICTINLCLLV